MHDPPHLTGLKIVTPPENALPPFQYHNDNPDTHAAKLNYSTIPQRSYNLDDMRKYQILKEENIIILTPKLSFGWKKYLIIKVLLQKQQKRFLTYFLLFHLLHKMYKNKYNYFG